jgi:hypothetical protein
MIKKLSLCEAELKRGGNKKEVKKEIAKQIKKELKVVKKEAKKMPNP